MNEVSEALRHHRQMELICSSCTLIAFDRAVETIAAMVHSP